jgi:uncharacterized membrane protein
MLVLLVLLISLLLLRALGAFGISLFDTWTSSTRFALALMFLFSSAAHFNKMRQDLARMMPSVFSNPMPVVYFTGVCEILGAIGILVPQTRSLAGLCLLAFLLAVLPANIKAAREGVTLGGRPVTALWLCIPVQILFLVLISWSTEPWRLWMPAP